jgi:nitrogen fixation NifU-like protein
MYSELVLDHFTNPRNVGSMPDADGVGLAGSPGYGDVITIFIKVKDNRVDDIKFQTFGCGTAIAASSMVTVLVKGKTVQEARAVTSEEVARALGGLPPDKMRCSNLAADAVHGALDEYERKAQA